jgi:hypothetical protein
LGLFMSRGIGVGTKVNQAMQATAATPRNQPFHESSDIITTGHARFRGCA